MPGIEPDEELLYGAAEGYPRYNPVQKPSGPEEDDGPDLSYEPLRTTRTVVARPTWEGWTQAAIAANRVADRSALLVALLVVVLSVVVGVMLLPLQFIVTVAIYAPLLGWLSNYVTRDSISRRLLRDTVHLMRQSLEPFEISQFESSVLAAILTSRRVPAGRESRLVLVNTDGRDVELNVVEYDMSKVEPFDYPSAGGG